MNQHIRNSPLAAVAFAAVALTATIPSVASAREEVVKAKVFHGDLDLATEAGVKALDRRLRSAGLRSPAPPTSASAPLPWRGTPQTVSWW